MGSEFESGHYQDAAKVISSLRCLFKLSISFTESFKQIPNKKIILFPLKMRLQYFYHRVYKGKVESMVKVIESNNEYPQKKE